MTDLIHAGVRGMKWRNRKTPMPSQMMGTLGNRIGGVGTLGPRIGGTGKLDTSGPGWTMSPESKALNRERMAQIAALFQKKPPIMQKKFSSVSDKTLNPEQRKAVDDFLKKRGIA